jgi:hypothetical protein
MSTHCNKNLSAGGAIDKHALLELGASFTLTETNADTDYPIAVATNDATTTNPSALTYELLAPGKIISMNCSAGVTALDLIAPSTSGNVKTAQSGDVAFAQATATGTGVLPCICLLSSHKLA